MARREYARIGVDMPEEESIKALDVAPQWLYDRLLLRPEISRCGVIPWVPGVISELAADATETKVRRWVKQLVPGRHVILDEKHAQLLVRTFVKHDKLLANPNVVPNLVYEFGLITSPKVRLAFLQEFRRLWSLTDFSDSERGGWLLAVGHFPMRKDADNPAHKDLRWPVALDARTLARLVKEIGPGIRNALTSAINTGDVAPFHVDEPAGIPDPFKTPPPDTPSRYPLPPTPSKDRAGTPPPGTGLAGTRTETETETETETGYFVPPTPETVSVQPDPARPAGPADTRTQPVDADQLIATHVGQTTGAVRRGLRQQITDLHREGLEQTTIAAALTAWAQRPGSGPGLLAYLANDLLLDDRLPKKPSLTVNGNAPPWCGHCDEPTRREPIDDNGHEVWARCHRCHPLAATTPDDTTDESPPAPVYAGLPGGPDEPPF